MKKITQKERVLNHLKEQKTITSWEAIKEYGCTRLADVIFRLKEEYNIVKRMVSSKNRFGDSVSYAEYKLIGRKTNKLI
jgi:hypothetical protein